MAKKLEEANQILKTKTEEGERILQSQKDKAKHIYNLKQQEAEGIIKEANQILKSKTEEANDILNNAQKEAEALQSEIDSLKTFENSIKNIIDGYGNEYIIPTYTVIDSIADEMVFTEPGEKLKQIRKDIKSAIKTGQAGSCASSKVTQSKIDELVPFVLDAFNAKTALIQNNIEKENYGILKQKMIDAFNITNQIGRPFNQVYLHKSYLDLRLEELKWAYTALELKQQKKEEQRQLREQMKEEERVRREAEKAQKEALKEKQAMDKALAKAREEILKAEQARKAEEERLRIEWAAKEAEMSAASMAERAEWEAKEAALKAEWAAKEAAAKAETEAKLAELEQRALEAELKNQRALSMAQQTKHGHVYIISNIGSFGDGVYKIGMTRRLDPLDRVKELGDASVPFPFDIHAMIECDDAPALEAELHRRFNDDQLNKVNPRKEFYRSSIKDIRNYLESKNISTLWTMEAEAAEYRESLKIAELNASDPIARQKWNESMQRTSQMTSHLDNDE